MTRSAQALAYQAATLASQGCDPQAAALFEEGLAEFPHDARLANSAGNFHFKAGRMEAALTLFERALSLSPDLIEAAVNAAITLGRIGQPARAVALLVPLESLGDLHPGYWRIRADMEREARCFRQAEKSIKRAAAGAPSCPKVARSQARLALECGAPDTLEQIERALILNRGDPALLFDYAQALAVTGRMPEALECTSTLVEHLPYWPEALKLHAELRWAAGELTQFSDHFAAVASKPEAGPAIYHAWCQILDGVDRYGESAAVMARARQIWPSDQSLALAQAVSLSEAGSALEAQMVFDRFADAAGSDWSTARARNLLRLGEHARAERELCGVLTEHPFDVTAWALRDVCWRLSGDARHEWLHGLPGLVRSITLQLGPAERENITALLTRLHQYSVMPIGQSVKQGSQTKGALFARAEPELAILEAALVEAMAEFRAGLPPADPSHPILSRRDDPWMIVGSWSIRLDGRGHHAPHIHPHGLLSSASYWLVPDEVTAEGQPGWLELGKPPSGIGDGLPSLHSICPEPGMLVLFPSTMFHGTRAFSQGTRMTVAFDVNTTA